MWAATGDMPVYQIRTPASSLPQGVVVSPSTNNLHNPQIMAEEVTRKRELRLLKNRALHCFQGSCPGVPEKEKGIREMS
ncbi:hypothetical protein XENTR_v10015884 [Xenopus tropicalis]|nr:hypothetical protein XENTR_v10015884 [Xenopus tropicalis]